MLSDLSAQPMEITMLGVEGRSLLCPVRKPEQDADASPAWLCC